MGENDDTLSREELLAKLQDSERKRISIQQKYDALAEKNRFLTMSFWNAPIPCAWLAPDGKILEANKLVLKLFDYVETDLAQINWKNFVPSDRLSYLEDALHRMTPTNRSFYFYLDHIFSDKVMSSYLWCNYGIFDENNQLIYFIAYCLPGELQEGIARHIWTFEEKRKNATEISHRIVSSLLKMLQESETVYNSNILHLANTLFGADDSCLFRFHPENNTFILDELDQSKQSKILALEKGFELPLFNDSIALYNKGISRLTYQSDRQFPNQFTIFLESNCIDYESLHTIPVFVDKGLWGVLLIVREQNTERWLESETELTKLFAHIISINLTRIATREELKTQQEAKIRAEESDRLKSAFVANMSHEIRTPLNAIVGFSEIIAETEDPDERLEYLKIIRNNNTLLLNLINDILDMSRIESGRTDIIYSEESVNELFNELYQSARIRLQDTDLAIYLEKPQEDYQVTMDRSRVMQIVMNFVNNAMKFTYSGSITLGYRPTEDKKGLYYFVRDTGCGIAKTDLSRIFHRFIKLNSFAQGTGLGLSICETLIKKMNGDIGVISKLGEGSEFWFTLPFEITETSD